MMFVDTALGISRGFRLVYQSVDSGGADLGDNLGWLPPDKLLASIREDLVRGGHLMLWRQVILIIHNFNELFHDVLLEDVCVDSLIL